METGVREEEGRGKKKGEGGIRVMETEGQRKRTRANETRQDETPEYEMHGTLVNKVETRQEQEIENRTTRQERNGAPRRVM
ncbi:hypothetical protein Pmani_016383 [Petrolisthes manimaculis]|uniref:Uncharacterized protein n=1 Tax=Petrolisthes manimaculis TaxID=1843537 RepID=A0AAE1UB28_9EUCA|nr:hypothetical protein Pmani_016383 [Petrolisthes manimaculis]